MRLNAEAAREKLARLSQMLGRDAVAFVEELSAALGIPKTLKAYNVRLEDFPAIVKESMPSGSLKANPKKVTEGDVEMILGEVAA